MHRFASRQSDPRDEDGFTLMEMLMGIAIMTIIMGAVAAALIVSLDNVQSTQARLGGSSNVQVTSANFVQDVQGAQYITTSSIATSPTVCGTGAHFLLGLYRPSVTANPGDLTQAVSLLSVGYWLITSTPSPEIVRYSCNSAGTIQTTTLISDDVSSTTQEPATITPSSFASSALAGWTPTEAFTTVTALTDLSKVTTLPVTSTAGFDTGSPIAVVVGSSTLSLTCSGTPTATTFTSCTKTSTSTFAIVGAQVSQALSVSGVTLTVSQPTSASLLTLTGAPRQFATATFGANGITGPGIPPLWISTHNNCSGLSYNGSANIGVNGTIGMNNSVIGPDGSASCSGTSGECKGGSADITSAGFSATNSGVTNGCNFNGTSSTTTLTSVIPDPYASILPTYGSASFPYRSGSSLFTSTPAGSTCQPGEYTVTSASVNTFHNCTTLEPGVYILDGGFGTAHGTSQTITEDPAAITAGSGGVLIYIPCFTASNQNPNDSTSQDCLGTIYGQINDLPGLNALQASQSLGNPALASLAIWQDIGNSQPITLGGNGSSSVTGVIYAPSAAMSASGSGCFSAQDLLVFSIDVSGGGSPSCPGGNNLYVSG